MILQLPVSPLLSQPQDESVFCDEKYFEEQNMDCGDIWCECIHRIQVCFLSKLNKIGITTIVSSNSRK